MKITKERDSLMALKDYNVSHFIGGFMFFILGAVIALFVGLDNLIVAAIGALFALVGIWLILSTKMVNITLDKGMNKAIFSLRSALKKEYKEVTIQQIKSLTLEKEIRRSSKGRSRRQFSLRFVLDTGEELPFEFGSVAGTMDVLTSPEEGIRKQAKEVAEFLGVPLKETGPPSISESISAVKDAVMSSISKSKKGLNK